MFDKGVLLRLDFVLFLELLFLISGQRLVVSHRNGIYSVYSSQARLSNGRRVSV